jgi:hypothetical protein
MPAAPDFPPPPDRVTPRRALISLSDKAGLEAAARALHARGVELVSTGGTRAAIAAAGLPVKDVSDLTGFPEMMDGRVKTLHPVVHGGLLGVRDEPDHAEGHDRTRHRRHRYRLDRPLSVRGHRRRRRRFRRGGREHRHRRPGHDPLFGQEPRLCRRLCRQGSDWPRCWPR